MTTYNPILATETDPDAPLRSSLFKRLVANPIAMSEGATTSPVLSTGWHPYDMVNVGDGMDGKFFDASINTGLTTVTTPTFQDGYDYLIRWDRFSPNNSPNISGAALAIGGAAVSGNITPAQQISGALEITAPTLLNYPKIGFLHHRIAAGANGIAALPAGAATPFTGYFTIGVMSGAVTVISFTFNSNVFDDGFAYLYRRRNFMFG